MSSTIKDPNNRHLPEELQTALVEVVRQVEREDSWVRKQQIRMWKKAERFWHGLQYIYWSETAQDWLSPINTRYDTDYGENREDAQGPFYDYVINIYKAYGESIIAALSAQIPAVRFPPDDADNDDDIKTSKVYTQVSDLIQRHAKSKIQMLQALLCLWNQGFVAMYHCTEASKKYGTDKIPQYGDILACPQCGFTSTTDEDDDNYTESCPQCSNLTAEHNPDEPDDPDFSPQVVQLEETIGIVGYSDSPRSRVCMEVYSPLYVKVAHWAKCQEETGYLIRSKDLTKSYLKTQYPWIKDKIDAAVNEADEYEKIGRAPSAYTFTVNDYTQLATERYCWIRPWQLEILGENFRSEIDSLKKRFPSGVFVCLIGDTYAEARDECLDDYWTVGKAGLSQFIHADSLGNPLMPLQEMRNVTKNLTLETVEQGIATVFADQEVIDFEDYSKHELRPGMYVPARKRPGERLADAFYEGPKAQLSKEVPALEEANDKDAQFVTGGFPSIYGGQIEGSSRTAAEYDMSRQMALQRLSICWTLLVDWWSTVMEKSVKLFLKEVVTDQRYVVKNQDSYINVWIRQAELSGKVGEVEAEGADSFPITIAQKQSLLLRLIQLNNEFLNAAIFDVENRKVIANALSFPELKIPQEVQRMKQSTEIQRMVESGSFIPIEPLIDDDAVHIEVLRDYLADETGEDLKSTNQQAYQMLMQHLQMHIQNQQMNTPAPPPGGPVNSIPQPVIGPGGPGGPVAAPQQQPANPPPVNANGRMQ